MRLREELFLLGHDKVGKTVVHPHSLDLGVAGAVLAEQALAGRILVSGGRVVVSDPALTGEPEIDLLLAAILRAPAAPALTDALNEIHAGAADRVRADLIADGVVAEVHGKRLGLIPVTRYPADEAVVRKISVGLWYAAHGKEQPDEPTATLCALVHAVLLHEHVFTNMPLTGLDARMREIRDRAPVPVRDIAGAVSSLVASRAVAIYR